MQIPRRSVLEWPGREAWPFLLLLLAVLVPTGFLLWFMNDAITRQSLASRQESLEAYRGQLRLVRTRTDTLWVKEAERLQSATEGLGNTSASRRFAHLIIDGGLSGAVLLDPFGRIVFPEPSGGFLATRTSGPAQFAQEAVRDSVRRAFSSTVGEVQRAYREQALEQIGQFLESGYSRGSSPDGRLVAADLQLLALELLAADDARRAGYSERLASLLNDYGAAIPSAQRLFLMGELRRLTPAVVLPTEDALRLTTRFLEGGTPAPEQGGFVPAFTRDMWVLRSADASVAGLYRTADLQRLLDESLKTLAPPGIRFLAYAPAAQGDQEAIAAGPSLPGWQISFNLLGTAVVDAAGRARRWTYVWVGAAGIAAIALLGLTAAQTFGRQMKLARLKADLTAAVSHELRAPLTSIRVLVDGLLDDPRLDPVKTREYLQLISAEHIRLGRVIDNFLTFARLERNQQRFVLVPTQPATIIQTALDAIRDRIPKGCELRVEAADNLPPILADVDAVATALVNLLDNALKYTPDEGKRILLRAYTDRRSVVLAVRDNGAGIPAREQRKVFGRFYRVDQRLTRETSGVGLGLSIVDLIVRAHRGTIELTSEPGSGSEFALRFPVADGRVA